MNEERLDDAVAFLREAVFRSRARQAAGVALQGGSIDGPPGDSPANCGLGEKAAVELDLSAEGGRLFERLWPSALGPERLKHVQDVMRDWVLQQDALDRSRNHFLRDFRGEHGFDRRAYPPQVTRAFEEGLEEVNAKVDEKLREQARRLIREP